MDYKRLSVLISIDIDKGLYSKYPKLEARLEKLSVKLFTASIVVNANEINRKDIKTLEDYGYLY
jgi:hypothetical protein